MKTITIYTSSDCEKCHEAKEFLDENKLQYTEYNISLDREAKKDIMSKGYRSVPLIIIDGKTIIGFDKKEAATLLGL